jgi:hypothetical protein
LVGSSGESLATASHIRHNDQNSDPSTDYEIRIALDNYNSFKVQKSMKLTLPKPEMNHFKEE